MSKTRRVVAVILLLAVLLAGGRVLGVHASTISGVNLTPRSGCTTFTLGERTAFDLPKALRQVPRGMPVAVYISQLGVEDAADELVVRTSSSLGNEVLTMGAPSTLPLPVGRYVACYVGPRLTSMWIPTSRDPRIRKPLWSPTTSHFEWQTADVGSSWALFNSRASTQIEARDTLVFAYAKLHLSPSELPSSRGFELCLGSQHACERSSLSLAFQEEDTSHRAYASSVAEYWSHGDRSRTQTLLSALYRGTQEPTLFGMLSLRLNVPGT